MKSYLCLYRQFKLLLGISEKIPLGEAVKVKKKKKKLLLLEKLYNLPEPFPHELVEQLVKYSQIYLRYKSLLIGFTGLSCISSKNNMYCIECSD